MKAIKYIFLSYFQQHFFGTFTMIAVFVIFIIGTVYIFNSEDPVSKAMFLFYVAIIGLSFDLTVHLKRLIKSNASALLPNYRRNQMITAGIVLAVFILVPIILAAIQEIEILPWLAIYLFTSSVLLWMFTRFTDNIFALLIVVWIIRFSYEILGLPVEVRLILVDPAYTTYLAYGMIIFSILVYYNYKRQYFRISVLDFEDNDRDETDPWVKDYDKVGKFTAVYLLKIVKGLGDQKELSRRKMSRLFQISIFSPYQALPVGATGVVVVLIYLISVLFFLDPEIFSRYDWIISILILIYYLASIMNTADFLQHRDRLAMLWLYSPAVSRSNFIRSLAGAYIIVVLRNYLVITALYLIIGFTIYTITAFNLLLLVLTGLIINLYLLALSLILFEVINTPEAKGWTVINILFSFILMPIIFKCMPSLNLIVLGVLAFVAGLLLAAGIKKLYQSDLDFESPAPYA